MMKTKIIKEWQNNGISYFIKQVSLPDDAVALISEKTKQMMNVSWYCGYAIVPLVLTQEQAESLSKNVDVHGDVTWIEPVDNVSTMFGFDCNHYGDAQNPLTKDIEWLTSECERLGEQLMQAYMSEDN